MEVRRYLAMVRRRLLLVVAIVAAALAAGWLITPRSTTYTACSTIYVGSQSIDPSPFSGELTLDRVVGFDRLITTFTAMMSSYAVADAALEETGVARSSDHVVANTSAVQPSNTNLIDLCVEDRDPGVARDLSNGVAAAFVGQIQTFEPRGAEEGTTSELVRVYEEADLPTSPNGSGLVRNLALAGILGVIVAGLVLALLEYLDLSLRSRDDVERHLELPVLATIPALGDHLPQVPGRVIAPVRRVGEGARA